MTKCSVQTSNSKPCSRPGVIIHCGMFFCRQHDPIAIKRRALDKEKRNQNKQLVEYQKRDQELEVRAMRALLLLEEMSKAKDIPSKYIEKAMAITQGNLLWS